MEDQTQTAVNENESQTLQQEPPKALSADAKPEEARKYKLKLGEQEEEFPESELAELVKAGRNANLTQKEAQELKSLLQQLKENPRKTLADPKFGIDLYKLAEETLLEKIQHEMLTPEQKKLKEYEQRFKEIEDKEKAEKEQKEKELLSQAETHWMQEYDKMFYDALMSSGLPKTPRTIKRMAEFAAVKLDKEEEIDSKSLVAMVKEDYLSEIKDLLGASEEDALLQLLGDEIGSKIRKADLKRLKGKPTAGHVTHAQAVKPHPKSEKLSAIQWRERMEQIKQGLE